MYNLIFNETFKLIPKKYKDYKFLELNNRIKLITYDVNDYFKRHKDGIHFNLDNNSHSEFSLLIYLNDDYDGGEIVIDRKKIKPTKGSVGRDASNFVHFQFWCL
jgi:prolyl 4-hydroxylase